MIADLANCFEYGTAEMLLEEEPVFRPNGLDGLRMVYQTRSMTSFERGGAPPGYPGLRIKEDAPKRDGPVWIHNLLCEGLIDGRDRVEEDRVRIPDEGFDEGPMTWLTTRPEQYARGMVHPTIPTLWLIDSERERIQRGHVYRVSGQFKGIVEVAGLPKSRKRRITVGNQVISSSRGMVLTGISPDHLPFVDENGDWTGWLDARYTALDSSRVQVSDSFITFDAPPTDGLPGHLTPENAPPVKDIFGYAWYTPANFTWNWPWGWTLKSISSEPLLYGLVGTPYLTTIVTEYVPRAVPK